MTNPIERLVTALGGNLSELEDIEDIRVAEVGEETELGLDVETEEIRKPYIEEALSELDKPADVEGDAASTAKRPLYGVNGTVGPAARFTWKEVACHDGTAIPKRLRGNAVEVARTANNVRVEVAKFYKVPVADVIIATNSWYRTVGHNRRIGGVSNSRHLAGDAMDVNIYVRVPKLRMYPKGAKVLKRVPTARVANLAENCARFKTGGIGRYPGVFTHLDTRGYRARWVGKG